MEKYFRVLTIAGSDSGGCAGVQADIKTIFSMGCFATTAITALTAQNTVGVRSVCPMTCDFMEEQLDAVLSDIGTDAVKIGMLADAALVKTVADCLRKYSVSNVVLDPVLVATSGDSLFCGDVAGAMVEYLFPLADLVTPNRYEAELLSGEHTDAAIWRSFRRKGCKALLLKGGHTPKGGMVVDRLYAGDAEWEFSHPLVDTINTHGTGCSLSSAIASRLALGDSMGCAVGAAIDWEVNAIASGSRFTLGRGHGPIDHFWAYRDK